MNIAWQNETTIVMRGIRSGSLKLLRRVLPTERLALYDLANDAGEQRDVLAQRPEDAARLSAQLDARLAATSAGAHIRFQNESWGGKLTCAGSLSTNGRFRRCDRP